MSPSELHQCPTASSDWLRIMRNQEQFCLHRLVRLEDDASLAPDGYAPIGKGMWSMRRSPSRTRIGLLIALGAASTHPAAAQVTFGSPDDPPRIAIGGGAFDVLPNKNQAGNGANGLALTEYRFGDVLWIVAPFVGVFGTGRGAFYGY